MNAERLQTIKDRWAKATPGPWWAVEHIIRPSGRPKEMAICDFLLRETHRIDFKVDQQAIAAAPSDIADLLAEIERLKCCQNCAKRTACWGSATCDTYKDRCEKWEGIAE